MTLLFLSSKVTLQFSSPQDGARAGPGGGCPGAGAGPEGRCPGAGAALGPGTLELGPIQRTGFQGLCTLELRLVQRAGALGLGLLWECQGGDRWIAGLRWNSWAEFPGVGFSSRLPRGSPGVIRFLP